MINHPNQGRIELTWQSILWRLFLTALLLMILAGSGVTMFNSVTNQPDANVLPTRAYQAVTR